LFEQNRIDHALAFRLAIRMKTSVLCGTKPRVISSFFYHKVVETSISFKDFRAKLRNTYPWSDADAVELSYFNSDEQRFLPLTCDEHMGLLFLLSMLAANSVNSKLMLFSHAHNM
jgi:hypothetical protein